MCSHITITCIGENASSHYSSAYQTMDSILLGIQPRRRERPVQGKEFQVIVQLVIHDIGSWSHCFESGSSYKCPYAHIRSDENTNTELPNYGRSRRDPYMVTIFIDNLFKYYCVF